MLGCTVHLRKRLHSPIQSTDPDFARRTALFCPASTELLASYVDRARAIKIVGLNLLTLTVVCFYDRMLADRIYPSSGAWPRKERGERMKDTKGCDAAALTRAETAGRSRSLNTGCAKRGRGRTEERATHAVGRDEAGSGLFSCCAWRACWRASRVPRRGRHRSAPTLPGCTTVCF
jgi:hypothetical protein